MSALPDSAAELILAVDAGGTKTAACLARATDSTIFEILGRGRSGSGNPLSVGFDDAVAAVSAAVADAAADADLPGACAARAVLSVAGASDPAIASEFVRRMKEANIARQITVVSDVLPVLAAGVEGAGVALIAGTGSVAYARTEDGRTIRCGGWGYLLGDDGGGFAIGRAALRFVLQDLEGSRDTQHSLTTLLVEELRASTVPELISVVYTNPAPRTLIASLAQGVAQAGENGNPGAREILVDAARDLSRLATRAARALDLDLGTVPLALTGGVLVGSTFLREAIAAQLTATGSRPQIRLIADPLEGCLRLASTDYRGSTIRWQ